MKAKIVVKEKHIKDGDRGEPESCPIALACRDAGFSKPKIGPTDFVVTCKKKGRYFAYAPTEAIDFIWRFDLGRPVDPFTMVVEFEEVTEGNEI